MRIQVRPEENAMLKTSIVIGFLILAALVCVMSPIFFRGSLNASAVPSPPPYCKPCLFYGGDFDPSGPSPNALENQDAQTGYAALYVAFAVPANQTWTVAGVFSNNLAFASAAKLAPPQIEWSISTGVSQGARAAEPRPNLYIESRALLDDRCTRL
jgi:hypothetical protein